MSFASHCPDIVSAHFCIVHVHMCTFVILYPPHSQMTTRKRMQFHIYLLHEQTLVIVIKPSLMNKRS